MRRFAKTLKGVGFASAAMLASLLVHPAAFADESLPQGWTRKAFDFGADALDFAAAVPADASVQTTAMKPREEGTAGNITIIGKVLPGAAGTSPEVTIQAFDLAAPGSTLRICENEAAVAGYTVRMTRAAPDLSEAELFATKKDGDKPVGGIFSRCLARGQKMLALHFLFDVSDVHDKDGLEARTAQANAYYETFITSLTFADGQSPGFRELLRQVPVTIGQTSTMLSVPDVWQVPINDFHGSLPAELHLLRKNESGKDTGLVWLSVLERKEKPNLEELGPALIRDHFVQQSPDTQPPVLLSSDNEPDSSQTGAETRNFRFSVKDKAGEDAGEIRASLTWSNGRLYVLSLWSAWPPSTERNVFFSRLPGLTAFDMINTEIGRLIAMESNVGKEVGSGTAAYQ